MTQMVFQNNAGAALSAPLDEWTEQLMFGLEAIKVFGRFDDDATDPQVMMVTITPSATVDSPMEIVMVQSIDWENEGALYVQRAQEGTNQRIWPAGSHVSARITAGVLNKFEQKKEGVVLGLAGGVSKRPNAIAIGPGSTNPVSNSITISKPFFVNRARPVMRREDVFNVAVESVFFSENLDLGVAFAQNPGEFYRDGAIVSDPEGNNHLVLYDYYEHTGHPSGVRFTPERFIDFGDDSDRRYEVARDNQDRVIGLYPLGKFEEPYYMQGIGSGGRFYLSELAVIYRNVPQAQSPTIKVFTDADYGAVPVFEGKLPSSQTTIGDTTRHIFTLPAIHTSKQISGIWIEVVERGLTACPARFYAKGLVLAESA